MSTFSKIILINQTSQIKTNNVQDIELIRYLENIFEEFNNKLKKINSTSLAFEVIPHIQKSPLGINKYDFDFAEVKLFSIRDGLKETIDRVHIGALKIDNGFKFTLSPGGYLDAYKIKEQGEIAQLRNEAIEIVAKELFKASNCEILITTSDHDKTPDSVNDAINWLEDSPFSMLQVGVAPGLEAHLGTLSVNKIENEQGNITINVTGQPFSLSRFNPDGTNSFDTYQRTIHEAINQLKVLK